MLWLEPEAITAGAGSMRATQPPDLPDDPMSGQPAAHAVSQQKTRLIMVLDHNKQRGTQFIQLLRHATPFRTILAPSLSHMHALLGHLRCHVVLLTDDTIPEEALERLSLLPKGTTPPALCSFTLPAGIQEVWTPRDRSTIIKALTRLLAALDTPPGKP